MFPLQTIMCPTDFSMHAAPAFELASTLAASQGARLIVLHVVPPPLSTLGGARALPPSPEEYGLDEAQKELEAVTAASPNVVLEHRLLVGDPAEVIVETARTIACDMIIMGTHGRSGLDRLVMGSVAESVARKAPCPVVTIKTPLMKQGKDAPERQSRASRQFSGRRT